VLVAIPHFSQKPKSSVSPGVHVPPEPASPAVPPPALLAPLAPLTPLAPLAPLSMSGTNWLVAV
jgi:hypothetical protein